MSGSSYSTQDLEADHRLSTAPTTPLTEEQWNGYISEISAACACDPEVRRRMLECSKYIISGAP